MRVAVSGGGTGGHIFPALAVCEALERLDTGGERLFIGGTTGMETEIVPKAGVPFQAVTARKLRKVLSPSTVGVVLSLVKGYREAKAHLQAFRAEAVVGSGGYVAAATVLAGAHLGLPTLILENNVVPGRTNRWLARYAEKVCVSFAETAREFPASKSVLTGMPLRDGIVALPEVTKGLARCRFAGLSADRFTVVVIGGSQGARAVNNLVLGAAADLLNAGIQILHQTGPKNFEEASAQARERKLPVGDGYVQVAFLEAVEVPLALRAADVIVCRGGISTLSEALANGLPALVIPLPTAYADHQTANAKALEAGGAGLHRAENELSASKLSGDLLALRDAPGRLAQMAEASRKMGRPDAADEVAKLVLGMKVRKA